MSTIYPEHRHAVNPISSGIAMDVLREEMDNGALLEEVLERMTHRQLLQLIEQADDPRIQSAAVLERAVRILGNSSIGQRISDSNAMSPYELGLLESLNPGIYNEILALINSFSTGYRVNYASGSVNDAVRGEMNRSNSDLGHVSGWQLVYERVKSRLKHTIGETVSEETIFAHMNLEREAA